MPPHFLVVEKQTLVVDDLCQTLREVAPAARILTFGSLWQSLPALRQVRRLDGAILNAPFDEIRSSEATRAILRMGAWIVCMNDRYRDEIEARGWHLLSSPFSYEAAGILFSDLMATDQCRKA